jgi:peptidoglycan/LPS O-acetylase OafA/YrhL
MDDQLPAVGRFPTEWMGFFVLIGAIGLVILAAFIWVLFIRKPGKQRVRRRKHKHRPLNRSIANSGGLPPIREKERSSGRTPPTPQP